MRAAEISYIIKIDTLVTVTEGSTSLTGSHVMEATGESRPDGAVPLYTLNSPPLSPSSFNPFAHPRKGVLKHSISQESESSMEILTKRVRWWKKGIVRYTATLWTKVVAFQKIKRLFLT